MTIKSYRGEIERLIPQLRQFARALVADHHAEFADDLVHDALAHALRAERSWTSEDLVLKLYTRLIGANRLRMRSQVGELRSMPGASTAQTETRSAGHSAASAGHSAAHDHAGEAGLSHVLGGLSLGDREALLLVVLGRLDYPQAAQVLGVPVGSLITRLTHAREQLGETLWTSRTAPHSFHRPDGQRRRHSAHLRLVKS